MVSNAVMLTFLYAIEPVYNVLNMSLSEDYFRLLMLIVGVVLVAIQFEFLICGSGSYSRRKN